MRNCSGRSMNVFGSRLCDGSSHAQSSAVMTGKCLVLIGLDSLVVGRYRDFGDVM